MSTSYGSCEDSLGKVQNAFYNSLWKQAAAQGITSFVSAGDNGGAGCDSPGSGLFASGGLAVNGISSTPYNVSVGGTQFDDAVNPSAYWSTVANNDPVTGLSVLGYIPEKVWNESNNDPNAVGLWAGSGRVSKVYAKPDWQAAPGVPNDGKRDIPDFSLAAALHDGYLICLYGYCSQGDYFFAFGGTSTSSPAAAGIMALVNQNLGGQPQGIANYVFYKLASIPGVYHDTKLSGETFAVSAQPSWIQCDRWILD
jgi:subtilase family serine protease